MIGSSGTTKFSHFADHAMSGKIEKTLQAGAISTIFLLIYHVVFTRVVDVQLTFCTCNNKLSRVITESCPMGFQSSSVAAVGDTVTLTCSVIYCGSHVPVVRWSPGSRAASANCSTTNRVCSSLSLSITSTTFPVHSCSVEYPSAVSVQPQCTAWNSSITASCT